MTAQLRVIADRIRTLLGYQARMDAEVFPVDDELLVLVRDVQDATERLFVKLHYSSCDGVGRQDRRQLDIKPTMAHTTSTMLTPPTMANIQRRRVTSQAPMTPPTNRCATAS